MEFSAYAVFVGDVGGYDGSEGGGSVSFEVGCKTAFATVVPPAAPTGFAVATVSAAGMEFSAYAVSVGDVGGYDGSEGGGSVSIEVAGKTAFATVVPPAAPTGFAVATAAAAGMEFSAYAISVGDVGGYDGSEGGGSVSIEVGCKTAFATVVTSSS